ncbi:DNA-binding Lrp family transcriptional regulator [Pseudomonas psychrotolerans]|nr:DNA-binding Lrp family transcriptional regulator [Pseudomonas psychrotolerans]
MSKTIDSTDWHLIHLLQQNARESTANLARGLGLARTTVVTRLARLEREGIIRGYSVRLSSDIENTAFRAYCAVSVLPRHNSSMIRSLEKLIEVEENFFSKRSV